MQATVDSEDPRLEANRPGLRGVAAVGRSLCELVQVELACRYVVILRVVNRTTIQVLATSPGSTPGSMLRVEADELRNLLSLAKPLTVPPASRTGSFIATLTGDQSGGGVIIAPVRLGDGIGLLIGCAKDEIDALAVDRLDSILGLGATAFEQAIAATSIARTLAQELRRARELASILDVGTDLIHTVLEGGDAPSVLQRLSDLVCKPAILYTKDFVITSWASSVGADRANPPRIPLPVLTQRWFVDAVQGMSKENPCLMLDPKPAVGLNSRHLLGRLTVSREVVGYLGVVGIGQDIRPSETKLVELVASTLSMQYMAEKLQLESDDRSQEEFLSSLLGGSGDEARLRRRAPLFGVDLTRDHVLVRVEYRTTSLDSGNSVSGPVRRSRIMEAIEAELRIGPPLAVGLPGADVLLVRIPRTKGSHEGLRIVKKALSAVVEGMRTWVDVRRVLISDRCVDLWEFPLAHRDLFNLSDLAATRSWDGDVYLAPELGVLRLLLSGGGTADSLRFAAQVLGPIDKHDSEQRGSLKETLRAYVTADGRINDAAKALDVHANTIRYRIVRIEKVLARSVGSLEDLMEFRIAFQLRDLHGTHEPGGVTSEDMARPELQPMEG